MSQAQLLTLIGVLFTLLCTVVGFIVKGFRDQLQALEGKDMSAVLNTRLDAVASDLIKLEGRFEQRTKDKDAFDHAFRHGEYSNTITSINLKLIPLEPKLAELEKRLDTLNEWKHVIGDAYLPRAVDEHERRLNRLDTKVFNGYGEKP